MASEHLKNKTFHGSYVIINKKHNSFCRNILLIENFISVWMAVAVGALGALVLSSNFYHDLWIFVFCFVIAGCQYCLLKVSVVT